MQLFGIRTELLRPGTDIVHVILEAIENQGLKIENGDILATSSKALATVQNRLKMLSSVTPSSTAKKLARTYDLEPRFAEVVLQEADNVYGGVPKALLTLKDHIFTANAGVDQKNSPSGYVALWPKAPFKAAEKMRSEILKRTGKHIGVLVVDSRVTPLRMGTTGLALAVGGFEPVRDCRVNKDLFGDPINITRHAVADDLASAAHLILGEADERTPAVLIKDAPVKFTNKIKPSSVVISADECLFAKHMILRAVKEYL